MLAVQKRMAFSQTESGDQAINSLADRMAMGSKKAIVLSRSHGQSFAPVSNVRFGVTLKRVGCIFVEFLISPSFSSVSQGAVDSALDRAKSSVE